jgi:heme/copper-type cytochrome/quinol oxidase subunit 3
MAERVDFPPATSIEIPPAGRMGMWTFLAGEVLIFGGLVLAYTMYRMAHPEWSEHAAHTVNIAGAINTMVLLTSSYIVVLAHQAAGKGENTKASNMLLLAVGSGFIFLGVKAYEYHHEFEQGITPVKNLFWSFYFLMTGLHALHVVGGMVAMAVIALAVRKGENPQRVELIGLYWHLVDIVWIFLFPLLYLAS